MKKFLLAGTLAAALSLAPSTVAFAQAGVVRTPGSAVRRVAHHQNQERERLHRHQVRERRRAADGGLTGGERARLARHQKAERQRLKYHQKNERGKLRDYPKG